MRGWSILLKKDLILNNIFYKSIIDTIKNIKYLLFYII